MSSGAGGMCSPASRLVRDVSAEGVARQPLPPAAPQATQPYGASRSASRLLSSADTLTQRGGMRPNPTFDGACPSPRSFLAFSAFRGDVAPPAETALTVDDARSAFARARRLADAGYEDRAILELSTLHEVFPRLNDRIKLWEADLRMRAGPSTAACRAYREAARSPQRAVAARARIGVVRCLLMTGDRDGVEALKRLRRRYPELPQQNELALLLAKAHEIWNERYAAARLYRALDLRAPGSPEAAVARERLSALAEAGVRMWSLGPRQQVDRARRLLGTGPYRLARDEVRRLMAQNLPPAFAREAAQLAARVARIEGRWQEAVDLLRQVERLPAPEGEDSADVEREVTQLARVAAPPAASSGRQAVRRILGRADIDSAPTRRLFRVLRVAAQSNLRDVVDETLEELLGRKRIGPGMRFEAGVLAAGTGSDEYVAQVFDRLRRVGGYEVRGNYYYGRMLERMGRADDAAVAYRWVLDRDSRTLPYYAMWARQRLRHLSSHARAVRGRARPVASMSCRGSGPYSPAVSGAAKGEGASAGGARRPGLADAAAPFGPRLLVALRPVEPRAPLRMDEAATEAALQELAEAHGEAYPWFTRALDLVRLGETQAADDELHEAYLAWRDALGRAPLRSGLLAVLQGHAPPRHRADFRLRTARRKFPADARRKLARVAAALGDDGMAIRLGGWSLTGAQPLAFDHIVERAAERYGVDPDLLHAVMRVESVYNPRVISYAGAIGLMQIMPRTGRSIAFELGREDFTVDELLDPETNVELAAWYLSSLIERFDGRVPLAVASYNGGPHNVRKWMRQHSPHMPLDAFLERIPFEQTHRYVRRVMTHYEAYRAQRAQPLDPLPVELPNAVPDRIGF